jgi:hypothetical protein
MRQLKLFSLLSILSVAGCAGSGSDHHLSRKGSETVLITYHVTPGKEQELTTLLTKAWDVYRKEKLVFTEPHVVVQDTETVGQPRIVEIFTWISPSSPDHAPDSVKNLWDQMQACCEKRNGGQGLEGGTVELLVPNSG